MKRPAMLVASLALAGNTAAAPTHDAHAAHARHATPAPAGVMGDHLHPRGDWMVSYNYMHMDMEGSLDGTDHISNSQIISPTGENFAVTPTRMRMDMHMLEVMYAPTGNLTLMFMAPYLRHSMTHRTRMGTTFTTGSQGVGDVQLSALYGLRTWDTQHLHLDLGISAPTGSIDEKDTTPMGRVRLPYPMQPGSGTWDLLAGLTYGGRQGTWAWGGQAKGTVRLQDENDNDYRLGNRILVTGWLVRDITPAWNTSLRVQGEAWGDIRGADPELNTTLVPTADPDLRGGRRMDILAGINYATKGDVHKGHTFGAEAGFPAWQDLDGPQLKARWTVLASWQYGF